MTIENLTPSTPKARPVTTLDEIPTTRNAKRRKYGAVFACGFALLSDGYLASTASNVNSALAHLYGDIYENSAAVRNVPSILFAGTVLGMLSFGYIVDRYGRRVGLVSATLMLILFSILCAGSYGAHGAPSGTLVALTVWRFFLGVGIGAEYPAGSAACSESTQDLKPGHRHAIFVLATNSMINIGFCFGPLTAYILLLIFRDTRLEWVWRLTLAFGAIPPLSVLYFRLKMEDTTSMSKYSLTKSRTPYLLTFKRYYGKLFAISTVWFIYNFTTYSFNVFSINIIKFAAPESDIYDSWKWAVVLNCFYLPGTLLGSYLTDILGPRYCLILGISVQLVLGVIVGTLWTKIIPNFGLFLTVYGLFLIFGEIGVGNNIGLISSKFSSSPVRGRLYSICSSVGKIGAFVGSQLFPVIINSFGGPTSVKGQSAPFLVAAGLFSISIVLTVLLIPQLDQECIAREDRDFRQYLIANHYDVSNMGNTSARAST